MIWSLLRKREATPPGPALLGKLPCQPDFVREGFRGPATDSLDAFLVQASPILHQGVGVAQLPTLLLSQSLPKQAHALVGVCGPSRDAAGRPFPAALVHALDPAELRSLQSEAFWRFARFLQSAESLLGQLPTLTLADARAELDELSLDDARPSRTSTSQASASAAVSGAMPPPAAVERALDDGRSGAPNNPPQGGAVLETRAQRGDDTQRGLGADAQRARSASPTDDGAAAISEDAQSYALYVVASAFAAKHPGVTLDCPALSPAQARLWLTLSARLAEVSASSLCVLYAPLAGRLLISIDAWHPGLLRAAADPGFSFDQLWPLATAQAEARTHARSALAQAGSALARPRSASVRELADQLAQFSQDLRG